MRFMTGLKTETTSLPISAWRAWPSHWASAYFETYIATDFRTWRTTMRIEKAKELLLADSECEISDIAKAVGLTDKSNFHRQFKQITGCTPSKWRETGGHPGILD